MSAEIDPAPRDSHRLADQGNAVRLIARHGGDIRHVTGIGWFVWDGTRWERDTDGAVIR